MSLHLREKQGFLPSVYVPGALFPDGGTLMELQELGDMSRRSFWEHAVRIVQWRGLPNIQRARARPGVVKRTWGTLHREESETASSPRAGTVRASLQPLLQTRRPINTSVHAAANGFVYSFTVATHIYKAPAMCHCPRCRDVAANSAKAWPLEELTI